MSEREEPPVAKQSDMIESAISEEDRRTFEEAWKNTREREERIRALSETPDADLSALSEDDRRAVERKRSNKMAREAERQAREQGEEQARSAIAEALAPDRSQDASVFNVEEIRGEMAQAERSRSAQEPTIVTQLEKPPQGGVKSFFRRLFGGK